MEFDTDLSWWAKMRLLPRMWKWVKAHSDMLIAPRGKPWRTIFPRKRSENFTNDSAKISAASDDDHVGTEHVMLGVWALGRRAATRALESVGITRQVFVSQLKDEAGTSPRGKIPFTTRARMIIALAGSEAKHVGSAAVEPEHILLGVIRESQRWEATGVEGPHHLRHAADAAGTSLSALEQRLSEE